MDMKNNLENFRDWLPVRGFFRENQAFIDWCFFGKERLTEPFFDDSVLKRFREPFNLLFRHQTPIEFLGELNDLSEGLKPDGFIFHLSRCGSTLTSQMLAALEQNIVISEASPVDFVLRAAKIDKKTRIRWLRWVINALGQKRNSLEENFFVKLDSWNMLEIGVIKRAFPDVPWIFLYRNPVEIIVSHIRQPGAHIVPGLIKGILPEFESDLPVTREEYCARVLGRICRSALDALENSEGLAVNYTELPAAVNEKILKFFNVSLNDKDLEKMLAAAQFNAKNPGLNFSADSEKKKKEASAAALSAAENFVNPFYERLEEIRKNAPANLPVI
jgi:hypothetical protein